MIQRVRKQRTIFVSTYLLLLPNYPLSNPAARHHSNGCGRTGTYILLDLVLNRIAKGVKEMDIAASLEHIRDQRPCMVETEVSLSLSQLHTYATALVARLHESMVQRTVNCREVVMYCVSKSRHFGLIGTKINDWPFPPRRVRWVWQLQCRRFIADQCDVISAGREGSVRKRKQRWSDRCWAPIAPFRVLATLSSDFSVPLHSLFILAVCLTDKANSCSAAGSFQVTPSHVSIVRPT